MFYKNIKATVPKEVLLFLGSHDKIIADYICPLFPPYISAEDCDKIMSKITNKYTLSLFINPRRDEKFVPPRVAY